MEVEKVDRKKAKVLFLFSLITLGFIIFLGTLFYWAKIDRRLPKLQTSDTNSALRGDILSADGFMVSTSQKLYKVMVDTRNINKDKKELLINLYSIYSGDSPKKVRKIINSRRGNVILSYKLDSKKAQYLKELSRKLYRYGVFVAYEDKKTKTAFLRGMSVVESGEDRLYPNKNILTPLIGYMKKYEDGKITRIKGVKGVEKSYEDRLGATQDALILGPKDIGNNVILNRNSEIKKRVDGYNVVLSISMRLQKIIERIVDRYKEELSAQEIIVGVMKSDTGEMLALATSNRFDPNSIKRKDYPNLNLHAIEYAYEPGSVMKAITLAILLREDKINPYDMVNTYNGVYKLGKRTIRDSHKYKELSVEDVIVKSSNIGTLQIAQKLDAVEFYQGLKDFGFAQKTGIDLPYEKSGNIPSTKKFRSNVYKATVGYGYGLQTTFMQVLKAYNTFNNNGRMLTPYVGVYLLGHDGKKHFMPKPPETQVLPISIAKRIQQILIKTVREGTGKNAHVEGLKIGGKTGTARIAVDGKYEKVYNGSFVGFANDEKNRFTIGVLTRKPKKKYYYFGSQSAAPVFKEVVEKLVEESYLVPKIDENLTQEKAH